MSQLVARSAAPYSEQASDVTVGLFFFFGAPKLGAIFDGRPSIYIFLYEKMRNFTALPAM